MGRSRRGSSSSTGIDHVESTIESQKHRKDIMNKSSLRSMCNILSLLVASTLSLDALAFDKPAASTKVAAPQLTQSYVWYEGNRQHTVWLNPQVVAEFNPGKSSTATAKSADPKAAVLPSKHNRGAIRLWQMNNTGGVAVGALVVSNPTGKYSPVFHDSASSNGTMRALPGNIIVYLNPTWDATAVSNWVASHKFEVVKKLEIGPNIYVIKTAPGLDALNTANTLYLSGEVSAAFPDWWQEVSTR